MPGPRDGDRDNSIQERKAQHRFFSSRVLLEAGSSRTRRHGAVLKGDEARWSAMLQQTVSLVLIGKAPVLCSEHAFLSKVLSVGCNRDIRLVSGRPCSCSADANASCNIVMLLRSEFILVLRLPLALHSHELRQVLLGPCGAGSIVALADASHGNRWLDMSMFTERELREATL